MMHQKRRYPLLKYLLITLVTLATTANLGSPIAHAGSCRGYLTVVMPGSPYAGPADIVPATNFDYDGRSQDLGTACGLIIHGNDQANTLYGSSGTDQIYGYGGNDVIFGQESADIVSGNDGDDQLWGGADNRDGASRTDTNDVIDGGAGSDRLRGGNSNALGAQGNDGDDVLIGGDGSDDISGGNDNAPQSSGDDGNDAIDGGAGDDLAYGGNDNAAQAGGNDGNDTITVGAGANTAYGGNHNQPGASGDDNRNGGGDTIDAVNGTIDVQIAGGNSDAAQGADTLRFERAEAANVLCDVDDTCDVKDASIQPAAYTFQGGVPVQAGAPLGLNQATLVLYVRTSDDATPNLNNLRTAEQGEFADVDRFYAESAFGQVSFAYTHMPNTGWYQLPRTYDGYMWTAADITAAQATGNLNAVKQAQDLQNLAQDPQGFFTDALQAAQNDGANLSAFSQLAVVVIGPFHRGTSYGSASYTLRNAQGNNFQVVMPAVVVSTNTGWSRTAHEFGHAFGGFADLYSAANRRMGNWDVMDCTDCGSQTTGWHKDHAGWNAAFAPSIQAVPRPSGNNRVDFTTTLVPYETAAPTGAVQSIRLDVGGGMHLYIENRQRLAGQVGSQRLPESAVIISDGNDAFASVGSVPIHLFAGPLRPGDVFTDQSYGNLRVMVAADPASAANRLVTVGWGADPYYDLRIDPWRPPPWESPDIWIDSQFNGWDNYEFTDGGRPIRNGDRPQVNVDNRLYARIHNDGNVAATNVRVSFYQTTPAGIGDTGNWTLLDRVTLGSIPAGAEVVTPAVIWRPTAGAHTCIIARIDHQNGEINANNNEAQENIDDFNTSTNSPWLIVGESINLSNPTATFQTMRLEVTGMPAGWTTTLSDRFVDLAPGETKVVDYSIDPGPGGPLCSTVDVNIAGYILDAEREAPLGGVTAAVHLVSIAKVNLEWLAPDPAENPEHQPSLDQYGAHISVSSKADVNDVPVGLFVLDSATGQQAAAFANTAANGTVDIMLNQVAGDLVVEPGGKYKVYAVVYGNSCVDTAQSETTEVQVGTVAGASLTFDEQSEHLADPAAFCAAMRAVDYDRLTELYAAMGVRFTTVPSDVSFDQAKAAECLQDYRDATGNTVRPLVCWVQGDGLAANAAEQLIANLHDLGIEPEIAVMSAADLELATVDHKCSIILRGQ